ncbi:MAG: hypothetical protein PHR64_02190 [Candidatus Shapirobacteria bacterium]|nr:hypothetical protein [Candidatus Shapirobacteria bacterium]MDD5073855.1 hypothetical protein [Candidatus Shapirobacteria bacterium]MDD5481732.1 hypothetical protein [Candidatus Shapirobacteria bacterium]
MFLNQFIVLFLLVLFFSWSLFLLILPKKRKNVSLESGLFLLMIAPETFLVLLLVLVSFGEAILGLIMGINLITFLLIPGLVALFRGQTKIKVKNLRLDFLSVFLVAALPLIFLKDLQISKNEGLALLLTGAILFGWRWRLPILAYRVLTKKRPRMGWREVLGLLLAVIFFLLSLLVVFSLRVNLPLFILGLLPLALIVSLPEILINLELTKNKPLVFLDGLLIPLVFNTTFILGLAAFLSPFRIESLFAYFRSVLLFLTGFALFYFFSWSKKEIDRREGIILLLYFFFSLVIILA